MATEVDNRQRAGFGVEIVRSKREEAGLNCRRQAFCRSDQTRGAFTRAVESALAGLETPWRVNRLLLLRLECRCWSTGRAFLCLLNRS